MLPFPSPCTGLAHPWRPVPLDQDGGCSPSPHPWPHVTRSRRPACAYGPCPRILLAPIEIPPRACLCTVRAAPLAHVRTAIAPCSRLARTARVGFPCSGIREQIVGGLLVPAPPGPRPSTSFTTSRREILLGLVNSSFGFRSLCRFSSPMRVSPFPIRVKFHTQVSPFPMRMRILIRIRLPAHKRIPAREYKDSYTYGDPHADGDDPYPLEDCPHMHMRSQYV